MNEPAHILLGLTLGTLPAPLGVEAQQGMAKLQIGFLGNADAATAAGALEAFRQGLRDLGWVERQTITIEYRWRRADFSASQLL